MTESDFKKGLKGAKGILSTAKIFNLAVRQTNALFMPDVTSFGALIVFYYAHTWTVEDFTSKVVPGMV